MAILAVNAGSSSLKFSLHPLKNGEVLPDILSGQVQGLEPGGTPALDWQLRGLHHHETLPPTDPEQAFAAALQRLGELLTTFEGAGARMQAVAHRVVHGGGVYTGSVLVTDAVLEQLARFNSMAPLHQPHNLLGIRRLRAAFSGVPQVACFDTAFHAHMPEVAAMFALPASVREQGVRRYGFHGLSYQYILSVLQKKTLRASGRVVMAHLGNGASLCAVRDGASVATTMGFSALDGLMMGTRSGALDPGVLLYLLEQGWERAQIEALLYKQSGLLGVSGISADMRRLRTEAADGNDDAHRAIDLFTHRVVRETGALTACLQGMDLLAFSGGIGENDAVLRAQVCAQLGWMGLRIDAGRNRLASGHDKGHGNGAASMAIHAADSRIEVWVVPTDEGRVAAREAAALLAAQQPISA
ncbi:acetate/propionate family kinase [Comamonas faecalis]|uniref:Acetate kinase n=1 Tax=Comamonas faecalis TaxID=1387849 RepID=A0ABP7QQU5_9BURK